LENLSFVKKINFYRERYNHEAGLFFALDESIKSHFYKNNYYRIEESFHFLPYKEKIRIIDFLMEKFYSSFGFYPSTIASLQLD